MLRNRARTVTTKQDLMAEQSSPPSPTQNHTRPISSSFSSPTFLIETTSPTSILDSTKIFPRNKRSWENLDPVGICLALDDEKIEKTVSQMVLFGSKPKIQIPLVLQHTVYSPISSPRSNFGIKTRVLQSPGCPKPVRAIPESISESEMELSEDYTCVIYHGPNPKTTHIYDDCVLKTEYFPSAENLGSPAPERFLGFCHASRKDIEDGEDIYMYRDEKSFCSSECRCKEMLLGDAERT